MTMNRDQQFLRGHQLGDRLPVAIETSALALSLQAKVEKIDADGPRIELSFKVGEQFVQAEDVVHGGAVTTMLDFAMAYVALLAVPDGLSVATINMNVSCLRSAKPGHYKAFGEIERCGKTVVFARARLMDCEDNAVASAVSSLAIVSPRRKPDGAASRP
ncbi:PaaI family thioesterase [Bradyrhizobium sp. ma5]|uniref:PaaI family thioesterase n=1 Tax=Bradyrhizobium sp. ma5 TaxID=3344828 RepID=UPI0035D517EE